MENNVNHIIKWIQDYFKDTDAKAVIGISGGKDSTVCAALLVKALGEDRVIGVLMPQGEQSDINDAKFVCEYLNIENYTVNIQNTTDALYNEITRSGLLLNTSAYTNTPARCRMSILYAIAAIVNGRVVNTCNRSEDYVGYSTKFGDSAGDFSILSNYTVTEILEIGDYLGLPNYLVHKTPADGLCGKSDEDNLGFTYAELDNYLLHNIIPEEHKLARIECLHRKNEHKLKPMPSCPKLNELSL